MKRVFGGVTVAFLLVVGPLAIALPTPGVNGSSFEAVSGRIFPEALATNDYIGYEEAVSGLKELESRRPDLIEFKVLGKSVGWDNAVTGAHDTFDVFAVEVTNEKSPIPRENKLVNVFVLSIHGNEKGGREGGLRVIEDLATGKGIAVEDPALVKMLDYQLDVFVFGNPDGWRHEEADYRADCPAYFPIPVDLPNGDCVEGMNFVRVNGNGVDLNRQSPTSGYMFEDYKPLGEPEPQAYLPYLKAFPRVNFAVDIHGMLTDDHFLLILLKDGERTPHEMFVNTKLAQATKTRLNTDPTFKEWTAVPDDAAPEGLPRPEAPVVGPVSAGAVWGGEFSQWAATYDGIGYSASATLGAFILQDVGLNAPGFLVEMAYNHIIADNYYPGAGAKLNEYHVRAVRDIVWTFMDEASKKVVLSVDTKGQRVAWLESPYLATSADDDKAKYAGWHRENAADDAFDIDHRDFEARPADYFEDLAPFLKDGDRPAVFEPLRNARELGERLPDFDSLVISGSAKTQVESSPEALAAVKAFVQKGGKLILTDAAIDLLVDLGVLPEGSILPEVGYAGYTNIVERQHPLVSNLPGFPKQTYDANPLGFAPGTSPIWTIDPNATAKAGITVIGTSEKGTNLGTVKLGAGEIDFIGALLPDPTEDNYHPYGLDSYAVTSAGNQILFNMLGYEYIFEEPPVVAEDLGRTIDVAGEAGLSPEGGESPTRVPGFEAVAVIGALLGGILIRRRR
ncbi:MAG: hypothetical protein HY556_08885 [Euryarchaeota archaeon]|nr:hypothetical protein [Euryarchaeota archaeon]